MSFEYEGRKIAHDLCGDDWCLCVGSALIIVDEPFVDDFIKELGFRRKKGAAIRYRAWL
jgi:hypothetical protein